MTLHPLQQSFILHFGEMGNRWGINRTVGQIYALLYLSEKALNADEIAEKLNFSRSNVSMGLKELQSWNLIKLKHIPSDRRDYFSTPADVWEIFRILAEEKRKREIEPTLTVLRDVLIQHNNTNEEIYAQNRIREMYELIELVTKWFSDIQKIPPEELASLMSLGSKVQKLLELKHKISSASVFGNRKKNRESLTTDQSSSTERS
jgi:DNA-binding transcriptional regulator GbsR (MarR family)